MAEILLEVALNSITLCDKTMQFIRTKYYSTDHRYVWTGPYAPPLFFSFSFFLDAPPPFFLEHRFFFHINNNLQLTVIHRKLQNVVYMKKNRCSKKKHKKNTGSCPHVPVALISILHVGDIHQRPMPQEGVIIIQYSVKQIHVWQF